MTQTPPDPQHQSTNPAPPSPPPPPGQAPQAPVAQSHPTAGTPAQGARPGELLDRFLARLIDGVILGIAYFILSAILGALLISEVTYDFEEGDFDGGSMLLYYIVMGLLFSVLSLGYFAFMEASRGQTVGKMLMKLRTVGPDGVSNPTTEQAVRRNIFNAWPLGFVIPVIGPILAGLAALVAEIMIAVGINNDPVNRQAWHDKFAGGTRVLKVG